VKEVALVDFCGYSHYNVRVNGRQAQRITVPLQRREVTMAGITYLDFDLFIGRAGDGYQTRVVSCPAGQATASFTSPFSKLELENFLLRVGRTRGRARGSRSPEMEAAKVFGGRLFGAIFDDEIRVCLDRSLDEANRQGAGLRIRLRLADVPDLADLPWEYLHHPTLNRFLVLSNETPLVRYLDLPQRIQPLQVKPPMRVLAMISSPADFPQLDIEREWTNLREALGNLEQRGLVTLERLEQATLAALQRRLRRGDCHVFHFIGHGSFDPQTQDGVLILEDEQRRGRPVSGQDLGTLLHDHRTLRLAILNACEGARAALDDPFAGAAQSLIQQGIPAVIAMQFEITDEAAITFAHEFYAAVADGYPVDAALAEARKAIFAQGNNMEWGTPVLYMRSPDGRIFDVAATPPAAAPLKPITKPAEPPGHERLTGLYTQALDYFYTRRWDKAIETLGAIVAEQADYEDAAGKLQEATRQQKLAQLYDAGLDALAAQTWAEASERLEAVVVLDAGYRDASAKLEEARRQKTLADLYAEARQLHRAQKWQAVVSVFERIAALHKSFPDPDGLLASAREHIEAAAREQKLATLYDQGLRRMDAGEWAEAQKRFEELQRLAPGYRETAALLARARQELAGRTARPRPAAPVQPVRFPWPVVGAVAGILVLLVAAFTASRGFFAQSPPTAMIIVQNAPASTEAVAIQPPATPPPSQTPVAPTLTPAPPTAPPTATPTLTATRTPTPWAIVAVEQANVRSGPGTEYPIVAAYPQGTALTMRGRNGAATWLVVKRPDGGEGWMAATTLKVTGEVTALPEVAAPPTPTPSLTPRWTITPTQSPTQIATEPPTAAPPEEKNPPAPPTPAPVEAPTPAPP
jgi:hypothetical protein